MTTQQAVKQLPYIVTVYDQDDDQVDATGAPVWDWNRREAYYGVMNSLGPHSSWGARVCEYPFSIPTRIELTETHYLE